MFAPREAGRRLPSFVEAASDRHELVEIEIVGESFQQGAIERIAGPKGPEGKQTPVGITFRCSDNRVKVSRRAFIGPLERSRSVHKVA